MKRYLDQIYIAAQEVRAVTDELIRFIEHKTENIHDITLRQNITLARYRELTAPEIMLRVIEIGREQEKNKQ